MRCMTGESRNILENSNPIKLTCVSNHHSAPELVGKPGQKCARFVPVPMREVACEDEDFLGPEPIEKSRQIRLGGHIRHRLGSESKVLAKVFARQFFHPWGVVPQRLPIAVHMPHQSRHPEGILFDEEKAQTWELLKDPFTEEADHVGHGNFPA